VNYASSHHKRFHCLAIAGRRAVRALGIPLALGKVKPNSFYGFRIAKTLNDESVWYKVNRFAGKAFIGSGIVIIALVFVVLWPGNLFSLGPVALQLLGAGIILVPIAVAVIASGVVCHRA
jgi:uncharacterized membrane protein